MITIKNLTKKYQDKVIFKQTNLTIEDSSKIHALVGKSGSGKTTLFNLLMGLDKEFEGSYKLFGQSSKDITDKEWAVLREMGIRIVFQDYKLLNNFSVYNNLYLAGDYSDEIILDILQDLEIADLKDHLVAELSGGQKQRVAIARAIISQPKILLLDEPTGNLDSLTTDHIMKYMEKLRDKGILIFMITHDEQLAAKADVTYMIQNHRIVVVKDTLDAPVKEAESTKVHASKKPIFQYILKHMKVTRYKIILLAIPITLLLTLFILGFTAFRASSVESFQEFFAGVSDQVIIINTETLKESVREQQNEAGIISGTDGVRIGFSKADEKNVRQLNHVEDVYLFADGLVSNYDRELLIYTQGLSRQEILEQSENPNINHTQANSLNFSFEQIHLPTKYLSHYNLKNTTILFGKYPKDYSDEILIPDVYVDLLFDTTNLDSLVGETLKLTVHDFDNKEQEKEYVISGIYDSGYRQQLEPEYNIYTSFGGADERSVTEETFNFFRQSLSQTTETAEFNYSLIKDMDHFKKAFGTGFTSMLVLIDAPEHVETVHTELSNLFPAYSFSSQYDIKHGDLSEIYHTLVRTLVLGSILIALVIGIIIVFLNKGQIQNRNREMAILYSIGYHRKDIFAIILWENMILFTIYLLLAGSLAYFANQFYFNQTRHYDLFLNMFAANNIVPIIALIMVMAIISVLWIVNGVKQKRLIKYLNE